MKLYIFTTLLHVSGIICFNVDVKNVINIKGPQYSYFGYSTLMFSNDAGEKWVIVGAIRANFTNNDLFTTPGNVFKCRINFTVMEEENCTAMNLEQTDTFRWADVIEGRPNLGYEEDYELLGSSMAMINDAIVVCAPLWKNLLGRDNTPYAYGRCFNVDKYLETSFTRPFNGADLRYDTSSPRDNSQYFYEFAQIGLSISQKQFGQSELNVLLGAPGLMEHEGGFVQYSAILKEPNIFYEAFSSFKSNRRDFCALTGYSITTGKIVDIDASSSDVVVVGAPHYKSFDGILGSVFLVTLVGTNAVSIKKQLFGKKSGNGFGSAVIFDDINNDGLDDLLVGAPLYFDAKTDIVDAGGVFIYYGNHDPSVILEESSQVLTGSGKTFGRFGTAMQCINDINKDSYNGFGCHRSILLKQFRGYIDDVLSINNSSFAAWIPSIYPPELEIKETTDTTCSISFLDLHLEFDTNDIVVSAPYEDDLKGAIYIYHGGPSELTLAQRITPHDIGMELQSFGWYISTAYDIDGNQYPDFLVGSYLSDTVSVFRARPIIRVNNTIDITPTVIPLNSSGLSCQSELFRPCVTIQVCFTYSGVNVPDTIVVVYNVTADTLRTKGIPKRSSRVYFTNRGVKNDTYMVQGQAEISKSDGLCVNMTAVVKIVDREFFVNSEEALVFETDLELVEVSTLGNVPSILDNTPTLKQASSTFSTVCIENCRPDLRIQLKIDPVKLILQEYFELLLTIYVYNDGDKALGTEIVIESSHNTKYINFHQPQDGKTELVTCLNNEGTNIITCDLRNTFFKETIIHLWFAVNNTLLIQEGRNSEDFAQNISVTAVVDSITTDRDMSDNQMTLTTLVMIQSAIEISGMSVPYELHITNDSNQYLTLTHKYYILNHGPSPWSNGRMYVCVPVYGANNDSITPENIKVNASSYDTTVHILQFHEGQWYRNHLGAVEMTDEMSCTFDSAEKYFLVKVVVNMLKKNTEIQVDIQVNIKEGSLDFGQLTKLVYTSVGEIFTRDDDRYIITAVNKTFSVSSIIYKEKPVSSKTITSGKEHVNPWIIVGSGVGGLVLLIIVTLILRKCGFFKRQKREEILRFKRHKHYHRKNSVVPEGVEVPHRMRRGSVQHHDDIHVSADD